MVYVVAIGLGIYLALCLLICGCQAQLVYYPSRTIQATPRDVGLAFEDVRLTTRDGVRIAAWYVPHSASRGTVIYFHGNAGNISGRVEEIRIWNGLGLSVLAVDYRGFGASEGTPDEQGTYDDAEAAWAFVVSTKGEPPPRVVLAGRSMGGAVAIELARRHEPGALVVESTFTSLPDVGQRAYWYLPVRLLLRYRYDSIRKVRAICCPKLFLHGADDELIPLDMARKLYAAACEPKRFIETPGDHASGGMVFSEEYQRMVGEWLEEVLAEAAQR